MSEKEYHIGVAPGEVGRYVILPGDPGRAEKIAGYFDDVEEIAFNREFRTFTGTVDGFRISVTSTGIVKLKVDPRSTSLVAVIFPPINSASC